MSRSITLHPRHGVNPTCGICFWCGESDGTVALLGMASKRLTGRDEAPRSMVLSYEPCDSCKAKWALGIMLAEVTEHPTDNRMPISRDPDLYPTGRYMVLKEEGFKRIFDPESDMCKRTLEKRRAFIDVQAFEHLHRSWEGNGQAGHA